MPCPDLGEQCEKRFSTLVVRRLLSRPIPSLLELLSMLIRCVLMQLSELNAMVVAL